ncbi:unnamed protein product [Didymodactylos carnosus]|uniref:Uncharacterized protein n=1 Tax=Didymodactylos carnosus TaxID=1234261 RepID=A0A815GHH6_9BILA|nr:unnamed protein product [Didymodactylos carnosus]CAF1338586.1 unnamed protein product [Didymodactylos carnosus]CAF3718570.1 unnamed protein product [Didymodactylos carnosus]CAF4197616.1 unnamed protein product [Didymodactylos carnosus]
MYTPQVPIAAVPVPGGRNAIWPLLAICCLALVGLLAAAVIVLALIPVYLTKTGENSDLKSRESPTIVIVYSTPADSNSVFTGTFPSTNNAAVARQLEQQLGLTNGSLTIKSISSVGSSDQRKRFCRKRLSQNFQQVVTTVIQISITLVLPNGVTIRFTLTFLTITYTGNPSIGPEGRKVGTVGPETGSGGSATGS